MKIGVLALQGDFREHITILRKLNVNSTEIRKPEEMNDIDGLIIPGGESTAISSFLKKTKLNKEIIKKNKNGMCIYGTCAGAIILAREIKGQKNSSLGLADIAIKRNDYGRQIESFETELSIKEIGKFNGIFIRAPAITKCNNNCEILAEFDDKPVMLKEDKILITTFHPELTKDTRIHRYFLDMVKNS
jgi:5'-phosphate synthase pdxT subunit|tara:strand:+ start:65 stop:631 length:567 start_codon:yes stop_codon:yes gene_type:complete